MKNEINALYDDEQIVKEPKMMLWMYQYKVAPNFSVIGGDDVCPRLKTSTLKQNTSFVKAKLNHKFNYVNR